MKTESPDRLHGSALAIDLDARLAWAAQQRLAQQVAPKGLFIKAILASLTLVLAMGALAFLHRGSGSNFWLSAIAPVRYVEVGIDASLLRTAVASEPGSATTPQR